MLAVDLLPSTRGSHLLAASVARCRLSRHTFHRELVLGWTR